jgi:peptidoglycan hydrolase-like protein with peptidoglycan-binding domain
LQVNGYEVARQGIFDLNTRNAVAQFQHNHKLEVTGIVERMTWALLCNRMDI